MATSAVSKNKRTAEERIAENKECLGSPCAVRHADSVCAPDENTADREKILISLIKIRFSPFASERYKMRTASGENKYKKIADGIDTASVTNKEYATFLLVPRPSLCALDTAGILAAAIP